MKDFAPTGSRCPRCGGGMLDLPADARPEAAMRPVRLLPAGQARALQAEGMSAASQGRQVAHMHARTRLNRNAPESLPLVARKLYDIA